MDEDLANGSGASVTDEGPIFLYDGDCGVCTRSVRFLLARDKDRRTVRFASLQGEVAAQVVGRHPELAGVDSMVWLDPKAGADPARIHARSGAVIAAGLYLGGFWGGVARLGRLIPRPLRDWAYDLFARYRRRIPGMQEACTLPTPEESARFLDR